jgi:hypothetical protein
MCSICFSCLWSPRIACLKVNWGVVIFRELANLLKVTRGFWYGGIPAISVQWFLFAVCCI